ncbi:hypothetical protein PpBr36_03852 [Pyricularia pennisetigena]|uniref:hypothetical protein n=1 Tax=Pyricularia pennisetigena TaxID=1578925 RepID=UPI00115423F1|nr:hypothetical protein PpBr36_03852 [Pyricularia pennisetigena]TLS30960.1 hypothetical protein PpBr36_03852 [Pyricularia pennisetigena]
MKSTQILAAALIGLADMVAGAASGIASAAGAAKEMLYESGQIHMEIMAKKESYWASREAEGIMNSSQYPSYSAVASDFRLAAAPVPCVNGLAQVRPNDSKYTFKCSNVDFYDFVSHADLGSTRGQGASSWGWTSPEGREFVAIAQSDGAAFAEVTKEGKLAYLGRLPQYSSVSVWREMKGYKSYLIIGSEATNHGVQIFDFRKLLTVDPAKPVVFSNSRDLTARWNGLPTGRSHNVVVNEEKNYGVAVGAMPRTSSCRSGLIFFDLTDPANPKDLGCASGDGYVHDAQCIVYRGPDTKYNGRDICYGYNEDTLTIYDVTDKKSTKIISRTTYSGAAYTHQGWVTNTTWQEYLVLDDEYDEYDRVGPGSQRRAVTYFWDIRSLESPKQTGFFRSSVNGVDHNQFVVGRYAFQSNYGSGLRVLDLATLPRDPTGAGVREVAYFDVYPEDDNVSGGGQVEFQGTWSSYPFFKSGFIVVNTIERGAYVLKMTNREGYETVHAAQLSLPTYPLTIPVLLLPLLALANTVFAVRSTALRLRDPAAAKPFPPRPTTLVTVLQVVQAIAAAVLATLLAASPAVDACLLEQTWQRMYSAHDGDGIRRVQDALGCCGFNSPRDRAWPFPHGRGGQQTRCDEAWGRTESCRAPWRGAMRVGVGVELGVVVVVEIVQVLTLLVLAGFPYVRRGLWYVINHQTHRREYPARNGRNEAPYRDRPLLADQEADSDSDLLEEDEADDEQPCNHCGRKGDDGEQTQQQQQSANNLPSLDSSIVANVWRGDN